MADETPAPENPPHDAYLNGREIADAVIRRVPGAVPAALAAAESNLDLAARHVAYCRGMVDAYQESTRG